VTTTSQADQAGGSDSVASEGMPKPQKPQVRKFSPREFKPFDVALLVLSALSSLSVIWIIFSQLTLLSGALGFVVVWIPAFLVLYWFVNRQLFTRQVAIDRLIGALVSLGAVLMMLPLVLLTVFVFQRGIPLLSWHLLTHTQQGVIYTPGSHDIGGVAHALVGTLEQVAIAAAMGIPAAVLTAIFINEVGGRFTRSVRVVVTAMSGTPAIVAGVFIYSVWVSRFSYSGFAGSLALAIILLPTVTRGTEEVLKVVHNDLREASMALAAPEWRTVWSVVLPTARSGLITSVLLGIAVSIGETAPLIMTIFGNQVQNLNPFSGPQMALSLLAYKQIKLPIQSQIDLGYTSALVLFILVFTVFILARILSNLGRGSKQGRRPRIAGMAGFLSFGRPSVADLTDDGGELSTELDIEHYEAELPTEERERDRDA
jgi:phosphate transport system permease protein